MSLNTMNWAFTKRYYLTHPWKWFSELFSNIRESYRRIRYGWAYQDCWNLDLWMLEILPPMLRHLAEGCAYPGVEPFETPEKWHDWLNSMADVLESLQEKNWDTQNEYEEDYFQLLEWHSKIENNHLTMTNGQDLETTAELYHMRADELYELRQKLIKDTFAELAKYFDYLWD